MRMRTLGSHGPEISVVGFGAWEIGGHWGPNPPQDVLDDALGAAFDGGINWVDTAEVYGRGQSESILAKALRARPEVMVFTKVAPGPAGTGFEPDRVRAACDASLRRLGRDAIDLYQLHWPDASVPLEDTWGAMAGLVEAGKVRHIGVSNFTVELIERCEKVRHVDSLQPHLSLLHRDPLGDLLPLCERIGTGVIAYGPLGYGLLTGAVTLDTEFHEEDWRSGKTGIGNYEGLFAPDARRRHLATVERVRPVADRLGITLAQLALAWVAHQPAVTGAIAGSRNPKHTADNARAGAVELAPKDLEEVDALLDPAS